MFDFESVDDFDKHINLSIPNYTGLCEVFSAFVSELANPHGKVVDIGCSTGRFLNSLDKTKSVEYIGIDTINITKNRRFNFIHDDAVNGLKSLDSVDVLLSMFSLQFMGKHKRKEVLSEVTRLVNGGAYFLVSEKCFLESRVDSVLRRKHLQKKRDSFTESEILNKEHDLFGSMFCLDDKELFNELNNIGDVFQVWQSYSFKAFLVKKRIGD